MFVGFISFLYSVKVDKSKNICLSSPQHYQEIIFNKKVVELFISFIIYLINLAVILFYLYLITFLFNIHY